ncbi:14488_t:CDS:2 [Dentiscutata erythropus]|uniref:14488_t:CDS:1 n=1 Tax=Dentiscutata erythropus TaxID=1348616 RepID=A0A9N9CAH4_9GLOM|nr:14488_t:CDS:2 [Dentiscutata erythropus]
MKRVKIYNRIVISGVIKTWYHHIVMTITIPDDVSLVSVQLQLKEKMSQLI